MPPRPPQPFVAPTIGTLEQRFTAVANAINEKANRGTDEIFNSVILIAPDGGRWQVTVSNTGALSTVSYT